MKFSRAINNNVSLSLLDSPKLQMHEKLLNPSIHLPEFRHGLIGSHSFRSFSHCVPEISIRAQSSRVSAHLRIPVNPLAHRQTYLSISDRHVPLFLQGADWHWSMIVSQNAPVIPVEHSHRAPDSVFEQIPPLRH